MKYNGAKLYRDIKDMENDQVNHETRTHNYVASMICSRRNKCRIVPNDANERKNKVKERLLQKIAAKNKAKIHSS